MKKTLQLIVLLQFINLWASAQHILLGKVISSSEGKPLSGATVHNPEHRRSTTTDTSGNFKISLPSGKQIIEVSYLGHITQKISVQSPSTDRIEIILSASENELQEVSVNTGYQTLTRERATGSFIQVDNSLLNRRVGSTILERLENNVPGLIFNQVGASNNKTNISIRGQSTLGNNTDPLIVVDNFPYDGDLNSINPNDVQEITVLRDAAAASIWGARAGNGVIVITSRKGKLNQQTQVTFSANLSLAKRPDLFYQSKISTGEYVEIQRQLFKNGYYNSDEQNDLNNVSHPALPQAVELLIAARDGKINSSTLETQLDLLKQKDARRDVRKYLTQNSVNQQYAMGLSGGTANQLYTLNIGHDGNKGNLIGDGLERTTLRTNQSFYFLDKRLQLATGLSYASSLISDNGTSYTTRHPYVSLADENGNPTGVPTQRQGFLNSSLAKGLLDWENRPVQEPSLRDNTSKVRDYRLNMALCYKFLPWLRGDILYQYGQTSTRGRDYNSIETFYTRNLVNTYTKVNADGTLTRPIPMGGILDQSFYENVNHSARGQLNIDKQWKAGSLTAIAGYELKGLVATSNNYRLYGYDDQHASSVVVDYLSSFQYYNVPATNQPIQNVDGQSGLTDRFVSYYANAGYTHLGRYTLTASARLDRSNLFGVRTNQKGVPLYSVGAAWLASAEDFYHLSWLPYLKLRVTYGYNGNIDKSLSAYTTARYFAASLSSSNTLTRQPYATILNPPNPELRWERVQIINAGLDFRLAGDRVSGSLEAYSKKGKDLISSTSFPPSSGITSFKGNFANMTTRGIELTLNAAVLRGKLNWTAAINHAMTKENVTSYGATNSASSYFTAGTPLVGKPLYSIYSYQWAGLDGQTGDPMGMLNGTSSKDYLSIINSYTPSSLVYNGSARPTNFGSMMNTFSYQGLTLSVAVSYKLGYYLRAGTINYGTDLGLASSHGDYSLRWQAPGDELLTHVPSVPKVSNARRDSFYQLSEVLIFKGDHIRLEDINLSYRIDRNRPAKWPFKSIDLYCYAKNLGIIWREAKNLEDPYYQSSGPMPFSMSLGVKIGL